jgi:tetratricopeptide (TPR) repeat protein
VIGTATLILIAFGAYANTFQTPFIHDDIAEIERNPALDRLWPPSVPMFEGGRLPHRPIPYLAFALNRRINRLLGLDPLDVRGFHLVNLGIHIANSLLIWWITTATLRRLAANGRPLAGGLDPVAVGWCVAAVWVAHPLTTQAVTYIYQRMESMAACFMLAATACFIAALDAARPRGWQILSITACVLAMASKETAVVLPLLILVYDRLLVAGSWAAMRPRARFYAALAACWLVVPAVMLSQQVVYGEALISWRGRLDYTLNQPLVILHYLRLAFWPAGMVFDADWRIVRDWQLVVGWLALATGLATLGWAWRRRLAAAFLGIAFLLLLAPSSSVIPASAGRACNEYRMYLPLACVATAAIAAAGGLISGSSRSAAEGTRRLVCGVAIVALVLAATTFSRNAAFASLETIWADTLAKQPWNRRGLTNLVFAHQRNGRDDLVLDLYGKYAEAIANHAPSQARKTVLLAKTGRAAEAEAMRSRALELARATVRDNPKDVETWFHLGNLLRTADPAAAEEAFQRAIDLDPRQADARANLGGMIASRNPAAAETLYRQALAADPTHADALNNLATLLARQGDLDTAIDLLEIAIRHAPHHTAAQKNLRQLREAAAR